MQQSLIVNVLCAWLQAGYWLERLEKLGRTGLRKREEE